ncbi:MAG TPA: translation elongation factor Ts [Firmicutes bacterium]|nr:translation elongation factor Ts [Bacillota bacterium]
MRSVSDAQVIKTLREKTGAGVMDCKKALQECGGDIEKAVEYLKIKGIASAEKKASREAREGIVEAYVHLNGKIGVLVELNCETDFVARNAEFKQLAHDLAMQVAAAKPLYVSVADVPDEVVAREREVQRARALEEGKKEQIVDKVVEGRMSKFFAEVCLLNQPFIKDESITVGDLIKQHIGRIGENITVKRFVRFEVGEA